MPLQAEKSRVLRFGLFEVDLQEQELRKSGIRIKLQEQPFQILAMLLEHRGQTVTREELRQELWPTDTFVDFDHSLNSSVKKLRLALGDDSDNPRFIETLHRRGYRFIAPVDGPPPALERSEQLSPEAARTKTSLRLWPWSLLLALAGIVLSVSLGWFLTHRPPSSPPALKERRLTANTSENSLTHGVISPDGKYLAYGDQRGMHLKLIQTGEITNIPQPRGTLANGWWPNAWFPDGTKFLASGNEFIEEWCSLWVVSVLGGLPHKLLDAADPFSVSPDGALIAFGTWNSPDSVCDALIFISDFSLGFSQCAIPACADPLPLAPSPKSHAREKTLGPALCRCKSHGHPHSEQYSFWRTRIERSAMCILWGRA